MGTEQLETYRTVAERFGISERRVAQLIKDLGLTPHKDLLDKRRNLLGPEHIEEIARHLRLSVDASVDESQSALIAEVGSLSSQVKDLQGKMQRLYETIAALNQTNAYMMQRLIAIESQPTLPGQVAAGMAAGRRG